MTVYCLLATCFAVACLVGWALSARKRRTEAREHAEISKATADEMSRCFGSLRNIFDHYGNYIEMDRKLNDLLFEVSTVLPQYARYLSDVVRTLRAHGPSRFEALNRDRLLSPALQDTSRIDQLVKEINDPVFNGLWEVRTPSALCEMLRHGLFLSLGYPESVAAWSPEGVNLSLNLKDPGYQNWGLLPLWAVKRKNLTWERWAGIPRTPSGRAAPAPATS